MIFFHPFSGILVVVGGLLFLFFLNHPLHLCGCRVVGKFSREKIPVPGVGEISSS